MNAQLVVGWDGSASARRALEWALRQDADAILLVEVVDGLDPLGGWDVGDDPRADGAVSLELAAADAIRSHPGAVVTTRVVTGDPLSELARLAGPDSLLVVGDRQRTMLRFRAGWSLGARLTAIAAGPVAIIAPDPAPDASGVVVGIDDSDDARSALVFAAAWAAHFGETLHVVHAWHVPFLWHDRGMPPAEFLAELQAQHAQVLADAVAEARRVHPELDVVGANVDGTAARALLNASVGRSLLVVGDGGTTAIDRMLLASVSHDILLNLSIPTVIVGLHATSVPAVPVQSPDGALGVTVADSVPDPAVVPPAHTIVGWDGSLPSRSALEWAVARERSRRGLVEVVMIADESVAVPDSAAAASAVGFDERAVERLLDQVRRTAPDVAVRGRVVRGFVLQTLAELTRPGCLLVLGTEDREGPRLRFDLSVGAHLAALAHGPIAIIPRTVDATLVGVAVGVDASELANAAILVAAAEAERRSETLHLVHAWVEPTLYESTYLLDVEFLAALEAEHHRILVAAELFARTSYPTLLIETHLVFGDPARALTELTPRPAMIVVGTRGLTGWRRVLLGSVSHQLVLNLTVPLIIVGASSAPHPDIPEEPESRAEATGMKEEAFV
ncbi:universal stress protein [Microbacteriaceae bacterium VKM Ac-2854]|nr:universal stress protein [Microbacteriaceae bacterium VKM Ac-2854]